MRVKLGIKRKSDNKIIFKENDKSVPEEAYENIWGELPKFMDMKFKQ